MLSSWEGLVHVKDYVPRFPMAGAEKLPNEFFFLL